MAGALAAGGAAQAKTKIAYQDSIQKSGSSTDASQSGCAGGTATAAATRSPILDASHLDLRVVIR